MTAELTVSYRGASTVSDGRLSLATEAGQVFFDGFASEPLPASRALACVAAVAGSRFFMPAAMLAKALDPVVTTEPGRLRFESFSSCAGVHARFDLVEEGLDVRACAPGTTNVDFNAPVRQALSRITRRDPLRLTVGQDAVTVQTLEGALVERRVPLPARWVKGFGEVQVALSRTAPVLRLGAVAARRFLDGLPGGAIGKATAWAVPGGNAVRVATAWRPGAVCLAGSSRLRLLQPLARYATGLEVHADPEAREASTVAWILTLPGGRIALTLSPDPSRGFSGEGGLLLDLVAPHAREDAAEVRRALDGVSRFSPPDVPLAPERARPALTWLGATGHLGFDAAERTYFWRHLPYPDELLRTDPPRLRDARALVAAGAVRPHPGGGARIASGPGEYRAAIDADGFRCTCPWAARHGTSRGPCKHVLAAALAAPEAVSEGSRGRGTDR